MCGGGVSFRPLANDQRVQAERFAGWMAARFNDNDGWDQIAFDLLTAAGKMEENPAVTYLIEGRHPLASRIWPISARVTSWAFG
jgi:hypothetical protein